MQATLKLHFDGSWSEKIFNNQNQVKSSNYRYYSKLTFSLQLVIVNNNYILVLSLTKVFTLFTITELFFRRTFIKIGLYVVCLFPFTDEKRKCTGL